MSQFLRCCKSDALFWRCYSSERNARNYYETLKIPSDASRKEIRQAFLKLSKQTHPDATGQVNCKEFVQINEAYNVLNKQESRRRYDEQLRFSEMPQYYNPRTEYYNPTDYSYRYNYPDYGPNDYSGDFYGIKGVKRVPSHTLAVIFILVGIFACFVQMSLINRNFVKRKEFIAKQNSAILTQYNRSVDENVGKTSEERIKKLEKKAKKYHSIWL